MSIPRTPWREFVTPQAQSFGIWNDRRGHRVMGLGPDLPASAACRVDYPRSKVVEFLRPEASNERDWEACGASYLLPLGAWRKSAVPAVRLHPFALFHLLVTQQVGLVTLSEMVERLTGKFLPRYTVLVGSACPLLASLQVDTALLVFESRFDLDVSGRRP